MLLKLKTLLFPPRRIAGAINNMLTTRVILFSHADVNVSMLWTCRSHPEADPPTGGDEIIQDFSGAVKTMVLLTTAGNKKWIFK
jgi:hypothetical protein